MFLIFLLIILCSVFNVYWLSIDLGIIILQLLSAYYIYRLFFIKNLYQLIGYASLTLVLLSFLLFWLQLDVFACFLLVAESIVMLFVLSLLMHLNYHNKHSYSFTKFLIIPVLIVVTTFFVTNSSYTYWTDWYVSQISTYNDLLSQFLYFYTIDTVVVYFIGVWLLFLTFLLVHLILTNSLYRNTTTASMLSTVKTQNIWSQWYKKPILRFFNKN